MTDNTLTIDDLLFVGFNRRVVALDKRTGELIWKWKAPNGTGFVSLLYEDERLFVSVQGYMYCLDPTNGNELWHNPLKGTGTGAASLATTTAFSNYALLGEASQAQQRASAAGASAAGS